MGVIGGKVDFGVTPLQRKNRPLCLLCDVWCDTHSLLHVRCEVNEKSVKALILGQGQCAQQGLLTENSSPQAILGNTEKGFGLPQALELHRVTYAYMCVCDRPQQHHAQMIVLSHANRCAGKISPLHQDLQKQSLCKPWVQSSTCW